MNWINLIFVLCLADYFRSEAKGSMLKCGEDIVVGRGGKKNLRFWSSEDELMKVEVTPELQLPPKKSNDPSALLSIFKNVPYRPIDSSKGKNENSTLVHETESEIIKKVTFPPAYRIIDQEAQEVAEPILDLDLYPSPVPQNQDTDSTPLLLNQNQDSDLSSSLMTQNHESDLSSLITQNHESDLSPSLISQNNDPDSSPLLITQNQDSDLNSLLLNQNQDSDLSFSLMSQNHDSDLSTLLITQDHEPNSRPLLMTQNQDSDLSSSFMSHNRDSDLMPSLLTQNNDDLFHPEQLDEIIESLKKTINQIETIANNSDLHNDTQTTIGDQVTTLKYNNELTTKTYDNDKEPFVIQYEDVEKEATINKQEVISINPFDIVEKERIELNEEVLADLNAQIIKLKSLTDDLDKPTSNVAAIRNQVIKLIGDNENMNHNFENTEKVENQNSKLGSDMGVNQIKTIEYIRDQIMRLKEPGEISGNLEEIISGVKDQILNLKQSIIPEIEDKFKNPENEKIDTIDASKASEKTAENVDIGISQSKVSEIDSENIDNQQIKSEVLKDLQELIVDDLLNTSSQGHKLHNVLGQVEAMKPEIDSTITGQLHQDLEEINITEDLVNLPQVAEVNEPDAGQGSVSHFDTSSNMMTTSEADSKTNDKITSPNIYVKEEQIIESEAVEDTLDKDNKFNIDTNNNAILKPQTNLEQSDNDITDTSNEKMSVDKKPEENQFRKVHSEILSHSDISGEPIIKQDGDSLNFGNLQDAQNVFKLDQITEASKEKVSQMEATSSDINRHPITNYADDLEIEDINNEPKKSITQSATHAENLYKGDKTHEDLGNTNKLGAGQTNLKQDSELADINIQAPKVQQTDSGYSHSDLKPMLDDETDKFQEEMREVEKPDNKRTDHHDESLLEIKTGIINSDNSANLLSNKVQELPHLTQSEADIKSSDEYHLGREDESSDKNFQTHQNEHITISIPKDILNSFTNKQESSSFKDNPSELTENIKYNDENTNLYKSNSEANINYPTKTKDEKLYSKESNKSVINDSELFKQDPILPKIVDTLKKIEADKHELVEKTIPKVILESLHKDSGVDITNDAAEAELKMPQLYTEVPIQSNFKNNDNLDAVHLPEAESEFTKLKQQRVGSEDNNHKFDTKPIVEASNENLSLKKAEISGHSQIIDKVTIPETVSVNIELEHKKDGVQEENRQHLEDTAVIKTDNENLTQHEMKLGSLNQHLDSTDNQNSQLSDANIGQNDETILTRIMQLDKDHGVKVKPETANIQEHSIEVESDIPYFDETNVEKANNEDLILEEHEKDKQHLDYSHLSNKDNDDESESFFEKPIIEMDYEGVINYNEEFENQHKHFDEIHIPKKEPEIADITQQSQKIQSDSQHIDETPVVDSENKFLISNKKESDNQQSIENQKLKTEYITDVNVDKFGTVAQNLPEEQSEKEQLDKNLESEFPSINEHELDRESYLKEQIQITDLDNIDSKDEYPKYPEQFTDNAHSSHQHMLDSTLKKTQNEIAVEDISYLKQDDVNNFQDGTHLLKENNDKIETSVKNTLDMNDNEKLKAAEIRAEIVRLIEGNLNPSKSSASNDLEKGSKDNIPYIDNMDKIEFDAENLKIINPENMKDETKQIENLETQFTAFAEFSDIKDTSEITELPNYQRINDAAIRKEEMANEKLSEILAKLNNKRVSAENDKTLKPIEIYPEDIGYDETQKEYIDANINILKSIVNQVATDLAVNKKEVESKIESNLKPINLIYKPDDESAVNEYLGIIDYDSDTDKIHNNEGEILVYDKKDDNFRPIIPAQTGDLLKATTKEVDVKDTSVIENEKREESIVAPSNIEKEDKSQSLNTDISLTQNNENTKILPLMDNNDNLNDAHPTGIMLEENSKLEAKLNLKEDALTDRQKETNIIKDKSAVSKSNQDVNMNGNEQEEISIPFGFLNWFGKDSAAKIKTPTIETKTYGKITTWISDISGNDHSETTTPSVFEKNDLNKISVDDNFKTADKTILSSEAYDTAVLPTVDEHERLHIINEDSVFSKESGTDNIISLLRDSVVKQTDLVQEETHSAIPIPFILSKLQGSVDPEKAEPTKPVIIKEHDSKVVFFTPNTNSVDNKSKNDDNTQENAFIQTIEYASETTTKSANDINVTDTVIFTNQSDLINSSSAVNNKLQEENIEEKISIDNVADIEFQNLENDNRNFESEMDTLSNESKMKNVLDSAKIKNKEPKISPEELLIPNQTNETTEDKLKEVTLLEEPVSHDNDLNVDGSTSEAKLTNEKVNENNFLSILEKYVIDESPVNSYIPEEVYHNQGTQNDHDNYNININNHNYQSIPINRFSFNNNDYENVRRRIDENMQDNINYEYPTYNGKIPNQFDRRHDNIPPADIYQSGSTGSSLSSLLQTRKGFIGPSIDDEHGSQGGAQLRRDDSQYPHGGEYPFFIKLPGSPNAVPVFLQYEPVQVKYVDPEKLTKKNPPLKKEQPILPLFKKNVTSNNQRSNVKVDNTDNTYNVNIAKPKIEDKRTNEIKSKPDPFFIMEAPDLGKENVNTDPSTYGTPESSPLITDDSLSVNLKGHLNFDQKKSIPSTIIGSKPVYPGDYVLKNPDNSYSSSDTQTLTNRVFDLGAKGTIPNSIQENPQYTPFPLTTNPPKTEAITPETIIISTTTETLELPGDIKARIKNETEDPQSVEFVTIPSINFNESFDAIAYPDLPLTERLRDDYGFIESDAGNFHEKEDSNEKMEDQLVPEIGLFATPKTGIPPKEEEFDIVALANFLHQNQKVWSNNNMAPISDGDGSWRGPVWNNLKYSNVNGEDSWQQPLGDSPWLTNEEETSSTLTARDYSAFYSPEEIPGLDPLYFSYRQMPRSNREPRTQDTEVENIKEYINKLPLVLKRAVVGDSPTIERNKRSAAFGEKIYCEWNFKTEPGLYLLVTFNNLSAPFTVDCYGAYIEVERESNGYGARWCGNRASLTGSRQHVIFAKHEVRIAVYDNGDLAKNHATGFEAEIEAIDLFDSEDYDSFMRSKANTKIRRLMEG